MKIHAEIEPVYILGDFSVKPAEKGWNIDAPRNQLHNRKLENTGSSILFMGYLLQQRIHY